MYHNTMLEQLQIYKTVYAKRRVGGPYDGGYVISDVAGSYDAIIAGGVCDDISFEQELLDTFPGIPCFAFDGTIDTLPVQDPRVTFVKKNIGSGVVAATDNLEPATTNLHEYIHRYSDIFLKMDIEGHEFRVFPTFTQTEMKKFKQVVIEIHSPFIIQNRPMWFHQLEDISDQHLVDLIAQFHQTHTLVHVHPNNACMYHFIEGHAIPDIFECTFLRNDLVHGTEISTNTESLPTKLDAPNLPNRPELLFRTYPFVG
ncbi:UNVERIFIED_CONTAM: hypothetical protein HDU68_007787 [Siphonaria sp. JEL0065]|nr:hypothetical protein HDU68_007787 [Siphonaria sp. JEL0065]